MATKSTQKLLTSGGNGHTSTPQKHFLSLPSPRPSPLSFRSDTALGTGIDPPHNPSSGKRVLQLSILTLLNQHYYCHKLLLNVPKGFPPKNSDSCSRRPHQPQTKHLAGNNKNLTIYQRRQEATSSAHHVLLRFRLVFSSPPARSLSFWQHTTST